MKLIFLTVALIAAIQPISAANEETGSRSLASVPPLSWDKALAQPKNLAGPDMNVHLLHVSGAGDWQEISPGAEGALGNIVAGDPTATANLPTGEHSLLLDLQDFYRVDSFAFRPRGAAGNLRLFAGDALHPPDSARWRQLGSEINFAGRETVEVNFPLEETSFVLIQLLVHTPGEAGPISLTGDLTVKDFRTEIPPVEEWDTADDASTRVELDLARLSSGGRVSHVGSGRPEDAYLIIDDDPGTEYEFPAESGDGLFLVQLSAAYPLTRASIAMNEMAGTIDVHLYENVPEALIEVTNQETTFLSVPSGYFETRAPDGRVELDTPASFARIPLPDSQARYILVRVVGDDSGENLRIGQFSLIGEVPREYLGRRPGESPTGPGPIVDIPVGPPDPPRLPIASP